MDRILIVDDDKDLQQTLSAILASEGYEIFAAENGKQAIQEVQSRFPNIVLLDMRLPDMDGMKILEKIKKTIPEFDSPIIILTAYGDIQSAITSMKLGAFDYITKPFDNEELLLTIQKAIKSQHLSNEVKNLREKLRDKIATEKEMGKSIQIQQILKKVEVIAPTNMSVIIQGKTGTGKEVIANLIHRKSLRKDKPFIPIDCGAIPENLIESELFGYEKGAFTSADIAQKGKFELADKGTLFLDEITNLPEAAQAKLLRALEEREIYHLGGKKPIKVDARIIAASNTDLPEAVSQGNIREDLYHRLNEFKIQLPLLKERKDDIPILANIFLKEANKELNKKIEGFSTAAIKLLMNYSWPGNVRELKNVTRRAVLLEEGEQVTSENLEFEDTRKSKSSKKDSIKQYTKKILEKDCSLKDITAKLNKDIEREIIRNVLEEVRFNKTKAAEILDIDRNTLYTKIKDLGIEL